MVGPYTSVAIFNVCKVEERETAQMHSCCSTIIALFRKGRSKHFISVILDYSRELPNKEDENMENIEYETKIAKKENVFKLRRNWLHSPSPPPPALIMVSVILATSLPLS